MAKKQNDSDEQLTSDELLEARVDAMMDPRLDKTAPPTDAKSAPTADELAADDLPPLDIFAGQPQGAPALPDDLNKGLNKAGKLAATPQPKLKPEPAAADSAPPDEAPVPEVPDQETTPAEDVTIPPAGLDNEQSDKAIDDIVAQESDVVLATEDAGLANAAAEADAAEQKPDHHGHPIFWFIIFLIVVVAVIAALMLMNPNLHSPFSH